MSNKEILIQRWIDKAEHDKGMAELALESRRDYADSICFHCQQYAEKLLKAVLIMADENIPRTHSLVFLLDIIDDHFEVSPGIYGCAESLQDYAVGIRYPADDSEPTVEDAERAYQAALILGDYLKELLIK